MRKRDSKGRFLPNGKPKKHFNQRYVKMENFDDAFLDAFELGVRATKDRRVLSAAQCLKDWKKENL